jgi:hypothetical protein
MLDPRRPSALGAALTFLFVVGGAGCTPKKPPPKSSGDGAGKASKPAVKHTPPPKLLMLALQTKQTLPKGMVAGTVKYFEKSGKNLYIELGVGDKTVGVELLPAVAKALKGKVRKGATLAVRGKRSKGEKEIAYVLEVSKRADVKLASALGGGATTTLVGPTLRRGPRPTAPLEMIAAIGVWPPASAAEVKRKVSAIAKDQATVLVTDSGLTELWKAYDKPEPYYKVISDAAAAAKTKGLRGAYYFPSFELRREKGAKRRGSLLKLARPWAQVTLSGKPMIKTQFGKQEFWNKSGDEALWVSPLSPWRKVFIERMKQAVKRGAKTLFIDVPYFQAGKAFITDGSSYAAAAFKQATGLALPKGINRGDKTYHRFLWWRHQVLRDFFRELRKAIREVDAEARLVVEEYPTYIDGATTKTGLDIGLIGAEVDAFAHEYSRKQFDKKPFSRADRVAIFSTLGLYRGLDADKPTWVLSYAHDAKGSKINAALHLAQGASFWETKAPEMNGTTVSRRWRRKLFGWFAKHKGWFGSSTPLASVAVVYSPRARDFCPDHFKTLRKVVAAFTEAGITYRVLALRDLDRASQYNVAVLPNICALSPQEARRLQVAGSKVPLVALGKRPSKGEWGIDEAAHGLPVPTLPASRAASVVRKRLVNLEGAKGNVAAALWQRGDKEVQLRLVSLDGKRHKVRVQLKLAASDATLLPYLGKEKALTVSSSAGKTSFSVTVTDLTLIRLRL